MTDMVGGWPTNLVPGEVKAIRREEHLCGTCFHAPVCKVATAIDEEFLIVITRCGEHLDATEVDEDEDEPG